MLGEVKFSFYEHLMFKQIVFLLLFLSIMPMLAAGSFLPENGHTKLNVENFFLERFQYSPIISSPQFYYDLPDLSDSSAEERFVVIFQTIFHSIKKTSDPFRMRVSTNNQPDSYYEFFVNYVEPALRIDFCANGLLYHALIVDDELYLSRITHEWRYESTTLSKSRLPWHEIFPALNFPEWNRDMLRLFRKEATTALLPVNSLANSQ